MVANGTLDRTTLESHVSKILGVKYDMGLFDDPYIPNNIDSKSLTQAHVPLTLEAARSSIVLLENRNTTLPLKPSQQGIKKIALVGPFGDVLNYGDYSGQWGSTPTEYSTTIRQAMIKHLALNDPSVEVVSTWGANTWLYNAQYTIPSYLLSSDGTSGSLTATYFNSVDFNDPILPIPDTPNRDWGLYPPNGLSSNNFSVIFEGELSSPVDIDTEGWLGVAINANTSARLYVDGHLLTTYGPTSDGDILSDIPPLPYSVINGTMPPPGSSAFTFSKGAIYKIRLEFQAWNYVQKFENVDSLNAQVELFWNLVDKSDAIGKV